MKSSGSSSATPTATEASTRSSASPRSHKSVALTGRSVALDPRTHAVRRDLADIRLADRVFAPHYASAVAVTLARAVALHEAPGTDETLAMMQAGDMFELLDVTGRDAWGVAVRQGLVGYLDATAIDTVT